MNKVRSLFFYILFIGLLIEFGIGYGGYWVTQHKIFSYDIAKQERRDIRSDVKATGRVAANLDQNKTKKKRKVYSTEILHPYLGFVVDFHDDRCPGIGFCDDRIRRYQTLLHGNIFPESTPNRAIVLVTGGSVAYGVANNSTPGKFEQALSTLPAFQGKEIILYTFALGGYKQPQQLFAMQYYMSIGAHFDMVINIDGFNDIVLPQVENLPFHVNPFFPRVWHERINRGAEDYETKAFHGNKAYLNKQRLQYVDQVDQSIFRHSALKNLIWKIKDTSLVKEMARVEMEFLENARKPSKAISALLVTGTKFELTNDWPSMLQPIAEFWRRASELMHATAIGSGVKYYHFLQPNQYVENSKPMTAEEKKVAFIKGHPYAQAAKRGYPYLISEGAILQNSEVNFYDLTMMFQDNKEVLYMDACCHFNTKGYDYIIDKIVTLIKADELNAQQL